MSRSELVLFLDSDRSGGSGNQDLWMTTRANKDDSWAMATNLGPTVNSADVDALGALSPDGSMLYFCSERPGGLGGRYGDIWQVPILPLIDFNGDGRVDEVEFTKVVDHWAENEPSCDIGPTPLGDGIVDVQDLIVLSEYIGKDITDPTLIAHWPLDEAQGVIAYDSTADHDGTLAGGLVWQPDSGIVAGALQFDGIDDYVSTDPVLNPADGKLSVVAYVKGGAPGQTILSQVSGVSWLCADSAGGCLMTELADSGRSSVGPMLSQANITDGKWHRIGFVWDGSYRHLYVDGVEVAKDAATLSGLESSEGGLYFAVGSTLAPDTFWSGLIDEVRIYNRAVGP